MVNDFKKLFAVDHVSAFYSYFSPSRDGFKKVIKHLFLFWYRCQALRLLGVRSEPLAFK